jgi:hypothetical protein
MESEDRKFYVTANRILDADVIGDVQYHPAGSSELFIAFKDPEKESISLSGDEADKAWNNFRKVVVGSRWDRLHIGEEEEKKP